jgi:hypothetical protein
VESIADNDVVNFPEFAAIATGVPMITRCDHLRRRAWATGPQVSKERCHRLACWPRSARSDAVLAYTLRSLQARRWQSTVWRIAGRVISVTQAGDIASVLLGFDNADDLSNGWVDLHTLLRIDGAWKIMNKTATHCSRAAWAAPTE